MKKTSILLLAYSVFLLFAPLYANASALAPTLTSGVDVTGNTIFALDSKTFSRAAISGNYLYVVTSLSATACVGPSAGLDAIGCELQVYDITDISNPKYVGGADASGSTNAGTGSQAFNGISISGNFAYVVAGPNATACSQTAGSAIGCELKVFDISTPSSPTYVGGADSSGTTNSGTASTDTFNDVFVSGTNAYVVTTASSTACASSTGNNGCELKVFSVSTPSTPTYVGGADASGSTNSGTGSITFNKVYVSGNYAYIASTGNATACSQSASLAIGCELQVYDISTPSTPTYVAGRDSSGNSTGTNSSTMNALFASGNYLYTASAAAAAACSQSAGSADGCEFKVWDITTRTNPTYAAGRDVGGDSTGTGFDSYKDVYVSGNNAYFAGVGGAATCSATAGSAVGCELQVWDVSTPTSPTYKSGVDSTGSINSGAGIIQANGVVAANNYVYVVKNGNATNCEQTDKTGCELIAVNVVSPTSPVVTAAKDASGSTVTGVGTGVNFNKTFVSGNYAYAVTSGSATTCVAASAHTQAIGCELQIYDISNPVNPVYVGGADVSGSTNAGTGNLGVNGVFVSGNDAYLITAGNVTTCAQTAGNAIGCELQVYDISTPSTPTYIGGADISGSTNSGGLSNSTVGLYVSGNDAYVTTSASSTACSQSAGSAGGCELQVYDISTPSTPSYIGGADASGSTNSGTTALALGALYVSGNFAYVTSGTAGSSATACSQSVGSAAGCELKVFNISTPSTPTYVGGADGGGSTNAGTSGNAMVSVSVSGNFAYVGSVGAAAACSGTAATTNGCEFKVFNISTPATPTYLGGADASGSTNSGTGSSQFSQLQVVGNYVFVSTAGSATACSQVAGSAIGCEFKVFDVTTSATPTYVGGADVAGTNSGVGNIAANGVFVSSTYAYLSKSANANYCPTDRTGCELLIFDVHPDALRAPSKLQFWSGFFRFTGGSIRIR